MKSANIVTEVKERQLICRIPEMYNSILPVPIFHTALPCPPNSHYSDCTPPCPPTCADLFPIFCPLPPNACVEGCQCNAGFVLSDSKCVSLSNCGCIDSKGEYHDVRCKSHLIHIVSVFFFYYYVL